MKEKSKVSDTLKCTLEVNTFKVHTVESFNNNPASWLNSFSEIDVDIYTCRIDDSKNHQKQEGSGGDAGVNPCNPAKHHPTIAT